jgi:hypothetical protein
MPAPWNNARDAGDLRSSPGYDVEEDEVWMAWQEPAAVNAVIGVAYPATDVDAPT